MYLCIKEKVLSIIELSIVKLLCLHFVLNQNSLTLMVILYVNILLF